ncbi:MAG: hypothetical protein NTZ83_03225 [Candidatus Pacearchaeota archaeon]|nr:hypothetical protein [Candidatus Pacearchaeota archaeon]
MRKRINWEEIYQAYTFGIPEDGKIEFPTLKDLSDIYKVSIAALKEHSIKEKWTEARESYLKDKRTKTEQKVIEKISDKIAPFEEALFSKAEKTIEELNKLEVRKLNDGLIIANTLRQLEEFAKSISGKGNNRDDENRVIKFVVDSEKIKEDLEKFSKGD